VDNSAFWDEHNETMPREELLQLQLERLQVVLNRAMRDIAFYRERFADIESVPDGVKSLEDLAQLPLTSREDLREGYPYGFFAVPLREVVRIDTGPGLSRAPTVCAYTRNDLKHWAQLAARVLTAAGVTADSVVQIPFEAGMFEAAYGFVEGARLIGASVVSVPGGDYRKQARLMHDYRSTVLVGPGRRTVVRANPKRDRGAAEGGNAGSLRSAYRGLARRRLRMPGKGRTAHKRGPLPRRDR